MSTEDTSTNEVVHIESEIARAIPRAHVGRRLGEALSRMRGRRVTARVTFSDVNGPKGGLDIRCAVQVHLAGRAPISAVALGKTPRLAFDTAYTLTRRGLERVLDRRQESERRPKKFYAAKQLLVSGGIQKENLRGERST